jgi:hypothetical protein
LGVFSVAAVAFAASSSGQGISFVEAVRAQTPGTQFELNISVAPGLSPRGVVIGTKSDLFLRDRARVEAPISNLGVGASELGVEARATDIYSEPSLTLRDRARVDGAVTLGGTLTRGNATVITGGVKTGVSFADPAGRTFLLNWPSGGGTNHDLQPGQNLTLLAGVAYGNISVKTGATLYISPGDHFVQSLTIEPDAKVILQDGAQRIAVYIKSSFTWRGKLLTQSGAAPQWLVGYLGTQRIPLERAFTGLLIAPSAEVTLGTVPGNIHTGQFFARKVEVQPDVRVVYQVSDFFADPPGAYVGPNAADARCGKSSLVANGHIVDNGIDRWESLSQTTPTAGCPLVELCQSDSKDAPRVDLATLNARLKNPNTPTTACLPEGSRKPQDCRIDPATINRAQTCNADTDCAGYKTGAVCTEYCLDSGCVNTARGCATRYDCTGADDDPKKCDVEPIYHCTDPDDVGDSVTATVESQLPPRTNVDTEVPAPIHMDAYLDLDAGASYCDATRWGSGNAQNGDEYLEPTAVPTPDNQDAVAAEQDQGAPIYLGSPNWGLFATPRLFHTASINHSSIDQFEIDVRAEGSLVAGARVLKRPITALDVRGAAEVTQCGVNTSGKFQLFGEAIAGVGGTDNTSFACRNAFDQVQLLAKNAHRVVLLAREAEKFAKANDKNSLCGLIKSAYGFGPLPAPKDLDCSQFSVAQLVNLAIKNYDKATGDLAAARNLFLQLAVGAEKTSGNIPLFDYGENFSVVGVHTAIPVGPLAVVLDAQVYGRWALKGGIDYALDMGSLSGGQVTGDPKASAGARITPAVGLTASLYVGVGIDFGIAGASVGLEGILKLIDADAPVRVNIAIERKTVDEKTIDPSHDYTKSDFNGAPIAGIPAGKAYKWNGSWTFGAGFGLESMSGDLNAAARVHFLFFSKTFRKKIAGWTGFPKKYFPVASATGGISIDQNGLLNQAQAFLGDLGFGDFSDQVAYTQIPKFGNGETADVTTPAITLFGCTDPPK